jgi:tripartite-type tricarboxylate transporter receptor subunit TctC
MRDWPTWLATMAFAAALAAGRADAQTSPAQSWPAKSIRVIVPYPPGGLSDVFARLIGDKLARRLGQSIVIDNRAGGNTIIGTQATAQSVPDGYTLLLTNGALSINQSLEITSDLASIACRKPWTAQSTATGGRVI